ncbi:MAG: hypothetical protein [Bacteriophage sp.]|nr:MAG: hypothetical protein [Bacteriophage sp.]
MVVAGFDSRHRISNKQLSNACNNQMGMQDKTACALYGTMSLTLIAI